MPHVLEGRVWKFGDNINTDLIFPNTAFRVPEAEQHRLTFSSNRPGWVDLVAPGDLLVAGENFGMGSGRPSGRMLQTCGIAGLVADSVNGLCLRNSIAVGLPAMSCPGVTALFEEGEIGRFDYDNGEVTNVTTGKVLRTPPLHKLLLDIIDNGGVLPMLINDGYVQRTPFSTAKG